MEKFDNVVDILEMVGTLLLVVAVPLIWVLLLIA